MTTDITELAQREKFEAWAEECNALPWGYLKKLRIYTGFYSDHTYTSLWAAWKAAGAELVEALEKAQKRISRLESRSVKLPKAMSIEGGAYCSAHAHYDSDGDYYDRTDVEEMLAAAGIKVEAE